MYDGSSDPYDHMLHFNQAIILNAGDDRLTEVAAAAGDEPSGPTSERGNGGRWMATATARLRLAANGLASLDYSSLLGSVYCDFSQIWKSFPFFW